MSLTGGITVQNQRLATSPSRKRESEVQQRKPKERRQGTGHDDRYARIEPAQPSERSTLCLRGSGDFRRARFLVALVVACHAAVFACLSVDPQANTAPTGRDEKSVSR